ncbi:hypothetical protein K466DRAFT_571048 [Polyporus arcularius HHB13444]|uniref:DUF4100 domain-containing protein n=1 Tax=Polyporus arcularius HHB13444 TaxID=1314778 RepID=A0A5C3NQ69_9APHY|nr:hypothetical protein K466DRAFT_571048 [Polyporus arcularius HHB13444]
MTVDGSELPRIPYGYEGGIAAYLHAQMPAAPTTHTVHSAGLVFENGAVLSNLSDYENRFDPRKRPQDKPSARQQTQQSQQPAPLPQSAPPSTLPAPPPTLPLPPPPQPAQRLPEPPHPINRKEGWKQSQPKAKGKEVQFQEDVVMRDGSSQSRAKSPTPASGYKHTTDLDLQTNTKELLEKILKEVPITLPLGQILGSSATLQDLLHEVTRRRRVPKDVAGPVAKSHTHSALLADASTSAASPDSGSGGVFNTVSVSVAHLDASGVPIVQAKFSTGSPYGDYVLVHNGEDVSHQQLAFSTFALSRVKNSSSIQDRMFAMATGVFTLRVNDIPFRCMVDSGSELNVALRSFPDVTRLPLDSFGEYWKLKGIHGNAEPLAGYVDCVPFQIGRHTFEHHVFISPHESIGESFDIILGQPFLTYFDARVEYSVTGETVLYLWADRNKEFGRKPTLGISITDPEDVRNKTDIVARLHVAAVQQALVAAAASGSVRAPPLSASVEEVEDEDYYDDSDF